MVKKQGCRFYRNAEGAQFGLGIGYCDLGVIWSICDGDVRYCERPHEMIRIFSEEWKRQAERPLRSLHL